jgi:hypothetical protein
VPVGVTGHRTQRPMGQVGPPGAHPAHPSSPLDPGGERWPIFRTAGLADHPAARMPPRELPDLGAVFIFLTPFNPTLRWDYVFICFLNPLSETRVHEIPTDFFLRLLSRHFYPRVTIVPTIRTIFSLTRLVLVDT